MFLIEVEVQIISFLIMVFHSQLSKFLNIYHLLEWLQYKRLPIASVGEDVEELVEM